MFAGRESDRTQTILTTEPYGCESQLAISPAGALEGNVEGNVDDIPEVTLVETLEDILEDLSVKTLFWDSLKAPGILLDLLDLEAPRESPRLRSE